MDPPPFPAGSRDAAEPDNDHDNGNDHDHSSGSGSGSSNNDSKNNNDAPGSSRRDSMSQKSESSQTAADFIRDQMQLEADAREALPYSIRNCTNPIGPLRQNIYACLTCNPPPVDLDDSFAGAGVCYSCSVQCHGEHELVEIFQKRNFTCDCGTTRFKSDRPCTLRVNPETNTRGNVHSEQPSPNNKYNQNFRNRFCSCSVDYQPQEQKGTMFQCLGLGTHESGGCGEDWYHPGCLVGQGPRWYEKLPKRRRIQRSTDPGTLAPISEDPTAAGGDGGDGDGQPTNVSDDAEDDDEDVPLPEGFPDEDNFDHFICYKCVEAHPWIKRYAGSPGFLPAVFLRKSDPAAKDLTTKKRKAEEDTIGTDIDSSKRVKSDSETAGVRSPSGLVASHDVQTEAREEDAKDATPVTAPECKLISLPPEPKGVFSLFTKADFREHLCHCPSCFPHLKPHPQLLEAEEEYEPSLSDSELENGSTHGSGSLYERGESALKTVDRVRAIEGVMAYNNLKEKLKPFFQQFAESGKAVGAEDIKAYFAKLRGDEEAIQAASDTATEDHRKEQSGY
ncbi:hypothetical protein F4861DRAFT_62289 [Xylaria intraflava]|nr:hypothetical protein F4861DRAFT_62289 [Xylaria intraflava]